MGGGGRGSTYPLSCCKDAAAHRRLRVNTVQKKKTRGVHARRKCCAADGGDAEAAEAAAAAAHEDEEDDEEEEDEVEEDEEEEGSRGTVKRCSAA